MREQEQDKLTTMRGGDGGGAGAAAKVLRSSGSKRDGGGKSVRGSGMPAMASLRQCAIQQQTGAPRERAHWTNVKTRHSFWSYVDVDGWRGVPWLWSQVWMRSKVSSYDRKGRDVEFSYWPSRVQFLHTTWSHTTFFRFGQLGRLTGRKLRPPIPTILHELLGNIAQKWILAYSPPFFYRKYDPNTKHVKSSGNSKVMCYFLSYHVNP